MNDPSHTDPRPTALHLLSIAALRSTLGRERLAELGQRSARALIITVPDQGWLTSVHDAAEELLPDVKVISFTKRERYPDEPDRLGSKYLALGASVWITNDLELLPPVVRLGADATLILAPVTTRMLRDAIRAVTGNDPRRLGPPDHVGLGLLEVAAAIRPNTSAAQCVVRLRRMARIRAGVGVYEPDPELVALPIVGVAAQDWAASVVGAFAAIRAGRAHAGLLRHTVLHGDPGVGKSVLARAVAARAGVPALEASIPGFFGTTDGHLGTVVRSINAFFDRLITSAPAIGILDEIDAVADRSRQHNHEAYWSNLVDSVLLAIDRLNSANAPVLLVGTTNLLAHLDPAVARPGRLGHHVLIQAPVLQRDVLALIRHHLERQAPGCRLSDLALVPLVPQLVGLTPARIADIVRAASAAALLGQRSMQLIDLVQALPGRSRTTADTADAAADIEGTARHEAAHCVLAYAMGRRVIEMSLLAEGRLLGRTILATLNRPMTLAELEVEVTILLAGRAIDQLQGPGFCTGSVDDLEQAIKLIGLGYTAWGFHAYPLSMPGESLTLRCARDPALASAINADLDRLQQAALLAVAALAEPIAVLAQALIEKRHLDADRIGVLLASCRLPATMVPRP